MQIAGCPRGSAGIWIYTLQVTNMPSQNPKVQIVLLFGVPSTWRREGQLPDRSRLMGSNSCAALSVAAGVQIPGEHVRLLGGTRTGLELPRARPCLAAQGELFGIKLLQQFFACTVLDLFRNQEQCENPVIIRHRYGVFKDARIRLESRLE